MATVLLGGWCHPAVPGPRGHRVPEDTPWVGVHRAAHCGLVPRLVQVTELTVASGRKPLAQTRTLPRPSGASRGRRGTAAPTGTRVRAPSPPDSQLLYMFVVHMMLSVVETPQCTLPPPGCSADTASCLGGTGPGATPGVGKLPGRTATPAPSRSALRSLQFPKPESCFKHN